ncbi:MAG: hypothetical protein WDN46_09860 [Methylocella sp.]
MCFQRCAKGRRNKRSIRCVSDERAAIFFATAARQARCNSQQAFAMNRKRPDRHQTLVAVDHRHINGAFLGKNTRRRQFAILICRALEIIFGDGGELFPIVTQGRERLQITDGFNLAPEAAFNCRSHVIDPVRHSKRGRFHRHGYARGRRIDARLL